MKLQKTCQTCEFNFDGICAGHGDTYKYDEKITDDSKSCDDWGASLDCFTEMTTQAPRFLREQFNDCSISYDEFQAQLENFEKGESIPINIFDAVKMIYGISMVDIAVLLDVSFGVVYRAKTKDIPAKRIQQFANVLYLPLEIITTKTTTNIISDLKKNKDAFFAQTALDTRLKAMPEWKKELARNISNILKCPIHIANEIARVDKLIWDIDVSYDEYTESEKALIQFLSKRHIFGLEYSLDLSCSLHIRLKMPNGEAT